MQAKIEALLRGLGCGFVPEPMARDAHRRRPAGGQARCSATGSTARLGYAWRTPVAARRGAAQKPPLGLALRWWLEQLESATTRKALLERHGGLPVGDRTAR